MNKSELVTAISEKTGNAKNQTESFLDSFVEVVTETVAKNDKVQLVGFGTFLSRYRESRKGHDPRTGKEIEIKACNTPAFKAGKSFKDALNG